MPVRVLDSEGYGTYETIAEGVYFAVRNGADVINLSLGGGEPSESLKSSLSIAHDRGVTLVVAGGNDFGLGSPASYPAAYDAFAISVGAVRYDGRRAWYSTRADYIDLSAPGGDLTLDQNRDNSPDGILQQSFRGNPRDIDYLFDEGTSFAAPHVSAAAAMIISCGLTDPDEIAEVLMLSVRDVGLPGWDSEYGYGILDVYKAMKYASKIVLARSEDGTPTLCNVHGIMMPLAKERDCPSGSIKSHLVDECVDGSDSQESANGISASSNGQFDQMNLDNLPNSIALYQNYPNSFNPETWIPYQLAEDTDLTITIYSMSGQLVRSLRLGHKPAGFYTTKSKAAYWDGRNEAGEKVSSGVYFYTIQAGDFTATKKMVLAR
jgi:hypothetical protein